MRSRPSSSLEHISQLLRMQYREIPDEPLPERWVDLINHLNQKERAAAAKAPYGTRRNFLEDQLPLPATGTDG